MKSGKNSHKGKSPKDTDNDEVLGRSTGHSTKKHGGHKKLGKRRGPSDQMVDSIPPNPQDTSEGKKSKQFSLLGYLRDSQQELVSPMHNHTKNNSKGGFSVEMAPYEEEMGTFETREERTSRSRSGSNMSSTGAGLHKREPEQGRCESCLYQIVGERGSKFLIRNRFVFYRLCICVCYFIVGVVYYSQNEGWNTIDCVYFITVSTTTVGYGDFAPSTDPARLFTTFYVIFGILVVLNSANKVIQYFVVKKTQKYILRCIDAIVRLYYRKCVTELGEDGGQRSGQEVGGTSLNTSSWFKLSFSAMLLGGMITGGTIFFMANEGFSFISALYWTVCTMLTIGYGDLALQNESTRVFLTWFIWVCVIVYVIAITNVAHTFEELKAEALRYEILKQHAVDIVDILDDQRKKSENEEEPMAMEVADMTDFVKVGFLGQESERKKGIAQMRQSLAMEGALIGGSRRKPHSDAIDDGYEDEDSDNDDRSGKGRKGGKGKTKARKIARLDVTHSKKVRKNALGFVMDNHDGDDENDDLMDDDELDRISSVAGRYPSRNSKFGGVNPLLLPPDNQDPDPDPVPTSSLTSLGSSSGSGTNTMVPEAFMQIKFDELDIPVVISDQDVKNIMRVAKRDRFVIDMLIKTGKLDPQKDVNVLETHFDKVENIRTLAARGDISRDVIADEMGVESKGGTLMGVAKNLIDQDRAVRKHNKSMVKASTARTAEGFVSGDSLSSRGTTSSTDQSVLLDNLRRGTALPMANKGKVHDELRKSITKISANSSEQGGGFNNSAGMGRLSEGGESEPDSPPSN